MIRLILTLVTAVAVLCTTGPAAADIRFELGLEASPTAIKDPAYGAVSEADLAVTRAGGDLRLDLPVGKIRLLPFLGYRFGLDEGQPLYIMETHIVASDFVAGLRVRGWLRSWFGLFGEVQGGLLWARLRGEIDEYDSYSFSSDGVRQDYLDDQLTWTVGGLVGVEVCISRRWLERRGVERFGFGADLGIGYIRRGDLSFKPALRGGDEHSLAVGQTAKWGSMNLSGLVVQFGATLSFL